MAEKDLLLDKRFECPICEKTFTSKVIKSGRTRLEGTDFDLKPLYGGIESGKYDVLSCPYCSYTALSRYFSGILAIHKKSIRENITGNVKMTPEPADFYDFDYALERYRVAIACNMAKNAKPSEKAYTYLKTGWVMRGYRKSLEETGENPEKAKLLAEQEEAYLRNAYDGFVEAISKEDFPIAGMDEPTLDYMVAQLAFHFGEIDTASKLVASVITSFSAGARLKDKARDLKDEILEYKKKNAQ